MSTPGTSVVVLGGGTAGTIAANHLQRAVGRSGWSITVVDPSPDHYYQPGFLFLPFGNAEEHELHRSREALLAKGIRLLREEVTAIDAADNCLSLSGGSELHYDYLIIASGCQIHPEEVPGLLDGGGWRRNVFDFYTVEGAAALGRFLDTWQGGRMVVHVAEMPIKCPVAPLEMCFLADDWFRRRGQRDDVAITYVTPLSGAFTRPRAASALGTCSRKSGSPWRPTSMSSEWTPARSSSSATTVARYPTTFW